VAAETLRPHFEGTIIAAGGFTAQSAEAILVAGDADLVAFGRHFVSNPDLPERLRNGWPLNAYVPDSFYGGTAVGYTDYPFYQAASVAA
jgi:N-ethylmaleimide reductase